MTLTCLLCNKVNYHYIILWGYPGIPCYHMMIGKRTGFKFRNKVYAIYSFLSKYHHPFSLQTKTFPLQIIPLISTVIYMNKIMRLQQGNIVLDFHFTLMLPAPPKHTYILPHSLSFTQSNVIRNLKIFSAAFFTLPSTVFLFIFG